MKRKQGRRTRDPLLDTGYIAVRNVTAALHSREMPRAMRFHDLTWFRITEVLVVSSPYDAFILEQDGHLTEQVFQEYSDLRLPAPPRFTHASTGEEAISFIKARKFDLVLTMTSLADMDVNAFGRKVKELRKGRPVILLALDRRELHSLRDGFDREAIDGAFLWNGDSRILLAIIKYVEDRENLEQDFLIAQGSLKVILMVEDSPSYYSWFLGLLYHELTAQALSLYSEGRNKIQRQMYMQARPKILHATSFEEGEEFFEKYRQHILALICDVEIPRAGKSDPEAGLVFARDARKSRSDLPILLQSTESRHREAAEAAQAAFIDKNSRDPLGKIRTFLQEFLGFGDFVFRSPDGKIIDRAHDLRDLEEKLATIPDESLVYHAEHNHFSIWLMARSEFEIAAQIRPRKVGNFPNIEATRQYLLKVLREARLQTHRGVVADFSRRHFHQNPFMRYGRGSLGGKARGIAFLNQILANLGPGDFGGLPVELPRTIVITADHFDDFLDRNDLRYFAYDCDEPAELFRRFLEGRLSDELYDDLTYIVKRLAVPLAVRSSSLLEDSLHQQLAGIYATLMLANTAADLRVRRQEICDAVKLVYASIFTRNAKSYLAATGKRVEEEKMAVIIQELVGRRYGERFYPAFSGVAQSFNFYPVGAQRAEDGVVHLALGLGRTVVDGGLALRFSPRHPAVQPQLANAKAFLDRSQRSFYALDMAGRCCQAGVDLFSNLKSLGLEVAEEDGTLKIAGSVYSVDDQVIRDDLRLAGPRLVTFNNILKHRAIPLAGAIAKILDLGKRGMGRDVEIELAVDMGDWGRPRIPHHPYKEPKLYLLQLRPFTARTGTKPPRHVRFRPDDRLCYSKLSLGNGVLDDIRDVIYVRYDRWQAADNRRIAAEIGRLNKRLKRAGRPYLLIGPGRWGTADEWLGIPVQWAQISHVKVMVEASPAGYDVEPSHGTHFFQNITSLEIGYLALPPGNLQMREGSPEALDLEWLDAQPAHKETKRLRWLRFEQPLTIVLDGREGRGVLAKPGSEPIAGDA